MENINLTYGSNYSTNGYPKPFIPKGKVLTLKNSTKSLPIILLIATYPPRQCGIATYTSDLIQALQQKFSSMFEIKICAITSQKDLVDYDSDSISSFLHVDDKLSFLATASSINSNNSISLVMVQHEFGLFHDNEESFVQFLENISKPIIVGFHTVLPNPDTVFLKKVQKIASLVAGITVMTDAASELLVTDYGISADKIDIIAHGTHLVAQKNTNELKKKYGFEGKKVITTFGFIGPSKNIETTLNALPQVINKIPDLLFVIVGKTHPNLFREQGDAYRNLLKDRVAELGLEQHVTFVTEFVPLPKLLEYLQLSDCYVFSSNDPNQAVSGTFAYAVSCGCPIISTPIPHAKEVLEKSKGFLFDFGDSDTLASHLNNLLYDKETMEEMRLHALKLSASNSWENSALKHASIFKEHSIKKIKNQFDKPDLILDHLYRMTTTVGIVQFSKINIPDITSGYTLDDNARALIAACTYFKRSGDVSILPILKTYLHFVLNCQRETGLFLNYLNENQKFTNQNYKENLEDSNGRAIWALGYAYDTFSKNSDLPLLLLQRIQFAIQQFQIKLPEFQSPRALAFVIKGLYYYQLTMHSSLLIERIVLCASKLVDYYYLSSDASWHWFESCMTYANSVLPEALLLAFKATDNLMYRGIAKITFDFLLSKTFDSTGIHVISNKNWAKKEETNCFFVKDGQQPIDVTYTILALEEFYSEFKEESYAIKKELAFNWFLGANFLNQIIYNPCTGGCHDGLEKGNVNLNQGAESTISYLLARMSFS